MQSQENKTYTNTDNYSCALCGYFCNNPHHYNNWFDTTNPVNQGTGSSEAATDRRNEAQPETPAPTTKYPIGGYAPGNYINNCVTCGEEFVGDKLARQCEPCAIETTTKIPAPTTQETNKCCLCNSFPCKCFGRIGEPPTTQQDKPTDSQIEQIATGVLGHNSATESYRGWVEGAKYYRDNISQQDKPVLSGEVYRCVDAKKNLPKKGGHYFVRLINRGITDTYVWDLLKLTEITEIYRDWPDVKIEWLEPISLPAPVVQDVEQLARQFHDTYIRLAPQFGYEPKKETITDWSDLPENNKALMLATVKDIAQSLSKQSAPLQDVEELAVGFVDWATRAAYNREEAKEFVNEEIPKGMWLYSGETHTRPIAKPISTNELYKLYLQSLQHRGEGLGSRGQ